MRLALAPKAVEAVAAGAAAADEVGVEVVGGASDKRHLDIIES